MSPPGVESTPDESSSATMLRLLVPPAIVGILFVGGVYWLRLHLNAAGGAPEQPAFIQVHLLPRPDPVPIPVNTATQAAAMSPSTSAGEPHEAPAAVARETLAALPSEAPAAPEPLAASVDAKVMPDSVANSAKATFRAELLRHIARFQRYPKAAERQHLRGTVQTVFSMNRDGKVLGVWVKTPSGNAVFDQAAIDTIRRAQPLPSIPPGLPDSIKVEIALGFDPS